MVPIAHQQLLETAYQAFNERRIEVILSLLDPDVDWANGMTGGRVAGREAVRRYWLGQWETLNPRVDPVAYSVDELGRTLVEVHQVVLNLEGTLLVDQHVHHAYRIEEGLVRSMHIL